jgi:ribonuclease P protein component
MKNTLKKTERLKHESFIQRLFKEGKSFGAFPLRVVWIETENQAFPIGAPVQVAFSVAKKNFKHAHDRNRIKRQLREAYRLQKEPLFNHFLRENKRCFLMIMYVGKEHSPSADITNKMQKIITYLPNWQPKAKI